MLFGLLQKRVHEPIALGALLGASISLHAAWILNLLFTRLPTLENYLTLSERIGPVTGMYAVTGVTFLVAFGLATIWFRGKDCAHFRSRAFWFFIASVAAFAVLTHPLVYEFELSVPTG